MRKSSLMIRERERRRGRVPVIAVAAGTRSLIHAARSRARASDLPEMLFLHDIQNEFDLMAVNIALLDARRDGLTPSELVREISVGERS